MLKKIINILNTPVSMLLSKRYHEITKLGGGYAPFYAKWDSLSYIESYKGWVYSAVTLIAQSTAKLERHIVDKNGKQIDHPYEDLITYWLIEAVVSYMKLSGTCYIWMNTIGGRIRSLEVLRPDLVRPEWDKNKTRIARYQYHLNGRVINFNPEEIIAIHNFNPCEAYPYQTQWFSDVQAVAVAIDTDNASSTWNWKFFENNASPGFGLKTEWSLSNEQYERVKASWNAKFSGVNNAHKLAIFEGGLEPVNIAVSQKEMDFVEQRRFSRDEILAIFKVPKAVMGLGDGTGGNMNIRSYQEIFSRNAIEPIAIKLQEVFNKYIFADIGKFEFVNIIPQDENNVRSDYSLGIISLNEARAMRWYTPIKWGDSIDTGSQTPPVKQYDHIAKSIESLMTKWTPENNDLKIKKRDKRLKKHEEAIKKAVQEIADIQESDIISQIEQKDFSLPDLNFWKYASIWMLKFRPIFSALFQEEWSEALVEVWASVAFKLGAPEVAKRIKQNMELLYKSVDKTTNEKLQKIISSSVDEWLSALEVRDLIKEEFTTMKTSRAEAIARTETIRASNDASIEAWDQSWVVETKQWWTALDDRVAPFDRSLHGKIIWLREKFFEKWDTITVGNETLKLDYSDTLSPPLHVNCRCTLLPIITQ